MKNLCNGRQFTQVIGLELKYTATHEQVMKDIKDFEEYILDRNFKNTYLIHASEEDKLILDSINVK